MPHAQQCFECAHLATKARGIAPPKPMASKPIATTFHLKRYLKNVGQKREAQSLFRMLVRIGHLFPHVSAAEMTSVLIHWSQRTQSPFDQMQIRQLVLDAKQWVQDHSDKRS